MDAEFVRDNEVDLDISVYAVAGAEVVQVRSEHCASFSNRPREPQPAVQMDGLHSEPPQDELGETRFKFANARHRVLRFLDSDELRQAVSVFLSEMNQRLVTVSPEEIRLYVRRRLEARDTEWTSLCAETKKRSWRNWALADEAQTALRLDPEPQTPSDGE
jgi:hypothetical protein